ncbi:MAG: alpha/beta hydrolase [Pseudomonadota bacterium]
MSSAESAHEVFEVSAVDGLMLRGRRYRPNTPASATPVLCLPGLSRNSRDFDQFAQFLSQSEKTPRQVISVDYRGRGLSDHDKDWQNYTPLTEATDVISVCDALGVHEAAIVGTSRGGLITMLLSAMRPGLPHCVVLNDVGPELDGVGLARIKTNLERSRMPASWEEAASGLKNAYKQQFTALSDADWDAFARMTWRDENGKPAPDFDPKLINTLKALDLDQPLPTLWPQFGGLKSRPLLVLRGANSDLLSEDILARMKADHPALQSLEVAGQGHAPLLLDEKLMVKIAAFINQNT